MISLDLARALADAGLTWKPASGDRFVIDQPELRDQVFTVSELTVEPHRFPSGTVLGFNGTTEWALDSVELEETLWLPREDQLRELLGATFRGLEHADGTFRVRAVLPAPGGAAEEVEHTAPVAADAYGTALLDLVGRSRG